MSSKDDVVKFLHLYKNCVKEHFIFINRKKNMDDIARFGLSMSEVKNILLSLTPSDYVVGPETDYNNSLGEVWTFGVYIECCCLYVKLKIEPMKPPSGDVVMVAKCLSFHEAQYRMVFPFRNTV